jgi:hypothetical protein
MSKVVRLFKELTTEVLSIRENTNALLDVAKDCKDLEDTFKIMQQITSASGKIDRFCLLQDMVIELFSKIEFEPPKDESASPRSQASNPPMSTDETQKDRYESISLRPNTMPSSTQASRQTRYGPEVAQYEKMQELFGLMSNDDRHMDYSGIYPRINFTPGSSPKEIRYWYDFGAVNAIYTAPPNFSEISLLPKWIFDGVKDCYYMSPIFGPKDIILFKFESSGPDYQDEENYPAYHFIQLKKAEATFIVPPATRKEFIRFNEKDIHYRRAIGMSVVI